MIGKGQRVVFGLLLVLSLFLCNIDAQDPVDCSSEEPGTKLQNPENCTQYYVCLVDGTSSDMSLQCPDGEYLDEIEQECVEDCGGVCTNKCEIPTCPIDCTGMVPGTLRADPEDCSNYYVCISDHESAISTCQINKGGPYFNAYSNSCGNTTLTCCNNCLTYCFEAFVEVRDPYDCSNFYLCTSVGIPEESDLLTCPEDKAFFNPVTGHCDASFTGCIECSGNSTLFYEL